MYTLNFVLRCAEKLRHIKSRDGHGDCKNFSSPRNDHEACPNTFQALMYAQLHRRFQLTVEDCIERLEAMAPARIHPEQPRAAIPSSASSPSLRSKQMVIVPVSPAMPSTPGGNVKVVVRVRGFLQRGGISRPFTQPSC